VSVLGQDEMPILISPKAKTRREGGNNIPHKAHKVDPGVWLRLRC
jgi:hypothetical protein